MIFCVTWFIWQKNYQLIQFCTEKREMYIFLFFILYCKKKKKKKSLNSNVYLKCSPRNVMQAKCSSFSTVWWRFVARFLNRGAAPTHWSLLSKTWPPSGGFAFLKSPPKNLWGPWWGCVCHGHPELTSKAFSCQNGAWGLQASFFWEEAPKSSLCGNSYSLALPQVQTLHGESF